MQLALSNSISQINGEKHIVVFLDITQLHNMHNYHIFAQKEWFIYYKDVKPQILLLFIIIHNHQLFN